MRFCTIQISLQRYTTDETTTANHNVIPSKQAARRKVNHAAIYADGI
jgi:hypothetical protein